MVPESVSHSLLVGKKKTRHNSYLKSPDPQQLKPLDAQNKKSLSHTPPSNEILQQDTGVTHSWRAWYSWLISCILQFFLLRCVHYRAALLDWPRKSRQSFIPRPKTSVLLTFGLSVWYAQFNPFRNRMDILELIDPDHTNNQQEMRPFPCTWEGCQKVFLPQFDISQLTEIGIWPSIRFG